MEVNLRERIGTLGCKMMEAGGWVFLGGALLLAAQLLLQTCLTQQFDGHLQRDLGSGIAFFLLGTGLVIGSRLTEKRQHCQRCGESTEPDEHDTCTACDRSTH